MSFVELLPVGQTIILIAGGVWAIANIKAMTENASSKLAMRKFLTLLKDTTRFQLCIKEL